MPLQEAAIAALEGPQDDVEERRATYERAARPRSPRRCPSRPSARAPSTSGSKLPEGLTAERLLVEQRVAVAPGEGFGPSGAGWARALARGLRRDARARDRAARPGARRGVACMKIGIVVPFSWSYWGGVVEHSENQAAALRARGHEVKIVMGHDPPGALTRFLHPRSGRHGDLPADVIPVGRSVVVPANGSLPNIVLSPRSIPRVREVLARGALRPRPPARADDARRSASPTLVVRALPDRRDLARGRRARAGCAVATPWWGFLIDRIDARIAVSRMAAEIGAALARRRVRGDPERRRHPGARRPARPRAPRRLHRPPRRAQGAARAAARVAGDPPAHGRAAAADRHRPAPVPAAALAAALRRGWHRRARDRHERGADGGARRGEGVRLARARRARASGSCSSRRSRPRRPSVASDIPGFAACRTPEVAMLVPPGDERALAEAVVGAARGRAAARRDGRARRARSRRSGTRGPTSRGGSRRRTSGSAA